MAKNGQGLHSQQVQAQMQLLSPVRVIAARLTELSADGLRDRIEKELEDNQWLEKRLDSSAEAFLEAEKPKEESVDEVFKPQTQDYADDIDYGIPRDPNATYREPVLKDDTETFFHHLEAQLAEFTLTDHELEIARYLIGSLEDDGLLRTPLWQIVDELTVYQYIDTTQNEVERLLTTVVQQMDPPGVGARDLQECLTLQARRNYTGEAREQLLTLFQKRWNDFSRARWDRIQHLMKLDDLQLEELRRRVRKLTPRPGGSMGREMSCGVQTVTPDFFVTIDDGVIRVRLNEGDLPDLRVSEDAEMALRMPVVTQADQEALRYMRDRVQNANCFISAIAMRRKSMLLVIKAIVSLQRRFFMTGDSTLLRPMTRDDISRKTGLDSSTVSRVVGSKYVQTPHGTFALSWFFSSGAIKDGSEVSVRHIQDALRQLVDSEDKRHPLTDEKLVELLRERGYAVARRTVAKYRVQLGIPESRLRS